MVYNDANRAFLQAFLARRILTYEEAEPILSAILAASGNPSQPSYALFQSFVQAANTHLSPLDFQIRSLPSQHPPPNANTPRTVYFILANTTSSPDVQLATTHSAEEISFFRRLLDAMFETNNTSRMELCAVKSMDAIRLHRPRPGDADHQPSQAASNSNSASSSGITMKDAETALQNFASEGWLEFSPAGYCSLSPRSLAELHRYLIDTYNLPDSDDPDGVIIERIKSCHGCKELLTIGQRCDNQNCPIRLHDACADGIFRVNRTKKCPGCGGDWSGGKFVGERAARGVKQRVSATGSKRNSNTGRPSVASQLNSGATTSRRRREAEEQEDEEEEMEVE